MTGKRYQDPSVQEAFDMLDGTLQRMQAKLDRARETEGYSPYLRVRISPATEQAIARHMVRNRLATQAEAIRQILAAGLAAIAEKDRAA